MGSWAGFVDRLIYANTGDFFAPQGPEDPNSPTLSMVNLENFKNVIEADAPQENTRK
jgi:hypothetical protein